jgi:hypothetical protein
VVGSSLTRATLSSSLLHSITWGGVKTSSNPSGSSLNHACPQPIPLAQTIEPKSRKSQGSH